MSKKNLAGWEYDRRIRQLRRRIWIANALFGLVAAYAIVERIVAHG